MRLKKHSYPPLQIGTSFMLVILIILSMIIFAVLSLSSAIKDYEYSRKNAVRTTEYYAANNLAEERLAEIILNRTSSMSDTIHGTNAGTNPNTDVETISFTVPVNDSSILEVVIAIDSDDPSNYQILTWKQISTANWSGNQILPVLGAE